MAIRSIAAGTTDLSATLTSVTAGDEIWFLEGAQAITAGLNWETVALNRVFFGPNFRGSIGGTSWTVRVDSGTSPRIDINSTSSIIRLSGGASGAVSKINIAPLSGEVRMTGGTFTTINAKRSDVYVDGGAIYNALNNMGAQVTIADNGTAGTTLNSYGGNTISFRSVATANVVAGRVYQKEDSVVTTLNVNNGEHYHQATLLSAGTEATTIGTANMNGAGTLTVSGSPGDTRVGTLNINHAGAKVFTRVGQVKLTAATTNDNAGAGTLTDAFGEVYGGEL